MSLRRSWRFGSPLVVVAAAASLGLAVMAVPGAVAASTSATVRDHTMYDLSVASVAGDPAALAQRLLQQGFDVTSRTATTVHVLGGVDTARQLARVSDAVVTGRRPAAPQGVVPAAPKSQDDILPRRLKGNHYQTYYGGYRTVAGFNTFEDDLAAAYPNLVQKFTYGTSFTGDNPLNAVCITANAANGCQLKPNVPKARFLVMSQIHAREIATSEMSWRYITRLIDGWQKDPQITSLLKSTEIWVVPEVNPDGITTVQNGIKSDGTGEDSPAWQRKNMDMEQTPPGGCDGTWAFSQPGVDLNRNFNSYWGGQGTSQDPCDQQFLGTDPGSESETAALKGLFRKLFKDQRAADPNAPAPAKTTGMYLTIHSDAGLVLMPWSYDDTVQTPNDAQLRSLAFRQSYFNHYTAGQWGEVLYNASGTSDDWTYDTLGIASFTWELDGPGACTGFLPLYSCMDAYEANNLPGLVYDAAAARTPYKLSLGPTILKVKAKSAAGSVTVTASADDDAFGATGSDRPAAQQITAGRIFVGTPPWDGGTAKTMTVHGSGTSATLTAKVTPGGSRVLAYVQAQDADGNWGPAEAVWIPTA